jgi:phosphoserine phosphatase
LIVQAPLARGARLETRTRVRVRERQFADVRASRENTMKSPFIRPPVAVMIVLLATGTLARAQDPLPSWNDGATKKSIVDFVAKVTKEGSPDFVKPDDRIATFDNDGTLWVEQPLYSQFLFALDRVKEMAPQHPEWKDKEPFASLLKGDLKEALKGGEHSMVEIVMATHAGMTTDEFEKIVSNWIATAKHPKLNRPYTECVYQPMVELLAYLRANGFKTFIVSGGGIEFMRPWAQKTYGVPPEQVVGSSIKTKFEMRDGKGVLTRLPEVDFIDDKTGKPIGINSHIGRRPTAAFGNSDGDRQMLEYAGSGAGARFCLLVHHDDAKREFAYGPDSKVGTFSDALMSEARESKWTVVSMKDDWKVIFPERQAPIGAAGAVDGR